jgi:DNA-binding XRE family transcriptional regulator
MVKPFPKFSGNNKLVSLEIAIHSSRKSSYTSQDALAAEVELDRSYMGGIERGENNPTFMSIR